MSSNFGLKVIRWRPKNWLHITVVIVVDASLEGRQSGFLSKIHRMFVDNYSLSGHPGFDFEAD
jgi:hypothetical protein